MTEADALTEASMRLAAVAAALRAGRAFTGPELSREVADAAQLVGEALIIAHGPAPASASRPARVR